MPAPKNPNTVAARAALDAKRTAAKRENFERWVTDQLAELSEAELLRIKARLDEITASRQHAEGGHNI